jgi:hypothetical protein
MRTLARAARSRRPPPALSAVPEKPRASPQGPGLLRVLLTIRRVAQSVGRSNRTVPSTTRAAISYAVHRFAMPRSLIRMRASSSVQSACTLTIPIACATCFTPSRLGACGSRDLIARGSGPTHLRHDVPRTHRGNGRRPGSRASDSCLPGLGQSHRPAGFGSRISDSRISSDRVSPSTCHLCVTRSNSRFSRAPFRSRHGHR